MSLRPTLRHALAPYLLAVVALALAAGLRAAFLQDLGRNTPYVTFYPALLITAAAGGLLPGLFCTGLAAVVSVTWIGGNTLSPIETRALGIFLFGGIVVSAVGEVLRRQRKRGEAAQENLERQAEELRAANEKLRQTEELMELALTAADVTAFFQDRELRYTWIFNPPSALPVSAVLGRTDAELLPAAEAGPLEAAKRRVLDRGESIREEVAITQGDRKQHFLLHARPLRDPGGTIVGLTGLSMNITERKVAADLLRRREERYRTLFEHARSVMLIIDPADGTIVEANPAAAAYYGWSREELGRKTIHEINQRPPTEIRDSINQALAGRGTPFLFRHRLAGGEIRDVEVFSGPIELQGRKLLLSIVHDITARQAAEERARVAQADMALMLAEGRISRVALLSVVEDERLAQAALRESEEKLRRLNLELEQRVHDRTVELEAANQELEAFNYSVSHDLRAPLRAIDGFARILEEDFGPLLGPEGRRVLGIIVTEERRMENLVNDLLRLSRLGRQALELQPVDLRELARMIGESMVAQCPDRVVHLKVADLPVAWADLSLIRQVLTNLLDNAFKFTGRRPVAEIVVGGRTEGRENVYFVADNGAGFDLARIDRLFGVFQRLHPDDEYKGTGVGLSLVRRIVQRHGGRVWAEGKVGEGATFYFALPVPLVPLAEPVPLRGTAKPFPDSAGG